MMENIMKKLALLIITLFSSITASANQWQLHFLDKGAYITSEDNMALPFNLIIGDAAEGRMGPDIAIKAPNLCATLGLSTAQKAQPAGEYIFNGTSIGMEINCESSNLVIIEPKRKIDRDYIYKLIESNKPIKVVMPGGNEIKDYLTFKNPNGKETLNRMFRSHK